MSEESLAVCLRRRVLWLNDTSSFSKVSEQVNRKCPIGTRFYNFQPRTPTPSPQIPQVLNHWRWWHLANTLKHTVDKRTAKISTSGIAVVSMLTTPYDRLFLSNRWATCCQLPAWNTCSTEFLQVSVATHSSYGKIYSDIALQTYCWICQCGNQSIYDKVMKLNGLLFMDYNRHRILHDTHRTLQLRL